MEAGLAGSVPQHKTEEDHLNIEKLTALICYNAHSLLTICGNMRCVTNKLKIHTWCANIKKYHRRGQLDQTVEWLISIRQPWVHIPVWNKIIKTEVSQLTTFTKSRNKTEAGLWRGTIKKLSLLCYILDNK